MPSGTQRIATGYPMERCETILEFQPQKVGYPTRHAETVAPSEEPPFTQLLEKVYQEVAKGRTRVPLSELQSGLLRRGWHP